MKVVLAQSAGFCYGVRRAVELAQEKAAQGAPCVMLGPIIHNKEVVGRLAAQGLRAVDRPEEVPSGCGVVIRSHGEGRAVHEDFARRGVEVFDATCPNVTHIHKIVAEAENRGRQPVVVGATDHPEVLAIAGWCKAPVVLSGEKDLEKWLESGENRNNLPLRLFLKPHPLRKFGKIA